MRCEHGWQEEEIIDFVLERLSAEKSAAFGRHVESCAACRESLSEWEETLQADLPEKNGMPKLKVKRRLMKEISGTPRLRLPAIRKTAMVFVAACVMSFVAFGAGIFSPVSHTDHLQQVNGTPRLSTKTGNGQIRYVPVSDHNVNGYVWVNGTTDELLLFLNGVSRINGKDYQAWLVSPHHQSNAGLLKISHGMARLYYQGPQMENARHIAVSVEPHGGSVVETGPEKFDIQLGR